MRIRRGNYLRRSKTEFARDLPFYPNSSPMIDFLCEARNIGDRTFQGIQALADVFQLDLDIVESFLHFETQSLDVGLRSHLCEYQIQGLDDFGRFFIHIAILAQLQILQGW
jgi:hypothetical protein